MDFVSWAVNSLMSQVLAGHQTFIYGSLLFALVGGGMFLLLLAGIIGQGNFDSVYTYAKFCFAMALFTVILASISANDNFRNFILGTIVLAIFAILAILANKVVDDGVRRFGGLRLR